MNHVKKAMDNQGITNFDVIIMKSRQCGSSYLTDAILSLFGEEDEETKKYGEPPCLRILNDISRHHTITSLMTCPDLLLEENEVFLENGQKMYDNLAPGYTMSSTNIKFHEKQIREVKNGLRKND